MSILTDKDVVTADVFAQRITKLANEMTCQMHNDGMFDMVPTAVFNAVIDLLQMAALAAAALEGVKIPPDGLPGDDIRIVTAFRVYAEVLTQYPDLSTKGADVFKKHYETVSNLRNLKP